MPEVIPPKISQHPKIIAVIRTIRDSFIGAEHVYTHGSCYEFARILKTIFPEGEIYENHHHAVFKYNHRFYDISGDVYAQDSPHDGHYTYQPAHPLSKHQKFNMIELYK